MSASSIEPLKALNELAREQSCFEIEREKLEKASKALSRIRNETVGRKFSESILIMKDWRYGADEIARNAVFEILEECKHDLLRLAELRLDAKAREAKIKAAQKRAVIAASIISVEIPK